MKNSVMTINALITVLICILFSLSNCKKADPVTTPTDPGNNGNNGNNGTVTDVSEKTVDTNGGILTLGIFTADIPKNAITTATKLTLTKVADKPFGTNQKSDVYYLNNLPDVIDQPITLSFSGFAQTDKVTTLLAESTFVPSLNKEMINYRPIANTFANGKLQITLDANTNNKSATIKAAGSNPIAVGVLAVSGQSTYTSEQGHFRLTFLTSVVNDAMDLAKSLEEAWSKYNTDPISLSYAGRTTWPVEVGLSTLENTVYGYMATSVWGNNSAYMCFNDTKLADKGELKITAGHEFMHFVQNLYDPRNRFTKAKFASPQLWVDEAVAVWAEGMFSSTANYVSTVRKGNEMSAYSPILKGVADGASTYGYGMSSMLKYLISYSGNDIVKKIYDQILAGQKPAEAIRLATGKFYWEWWGRYIDQNSLGKLYNDIPIGLLVGSKADSYSINTTADSVKEFASAYGQLQSKIVVTTLNPDAFDTSDSLLIAIKTPNTEMVNVYKFTNTAFEKIGQDLQQVNVPNIKSVAQAGYKILTVVTNQKYDYTSDVSQNITLVTRTQKKVDHKVLNKTKKIWYSTIQAGIDDAGLTDSILVYPGIYKEYVRITSKNIVILSKSGPATTLLEGADGGSGFYLMNCSPVIKGFTLHKYDTGIFVVESGNGTTIKPVIDGNLIIDNASTGVYISGNAAPQIQNNVFSNNHYYGIQFDRYGTITVDIPTQISSNRFMDNDRGIQIQGDVTAEITENSFVRSSSYGIEVIGKARVAISKDTLNSCAFAGIRLYNLKNPSTISGSIFTQNGNGIDAIADGKQLITGNTFLNNRNPIYLELGTTSAADGEISQNTISASTVNNYENSGVGIIIAYSPKPGKILIKGNMISNNEGGGIQMKTSNDVEVSANTITGNTAYYGGGIYASSSGNIVIKQNTISKNKAQSYGGGIYSDNSSSSKIATITGNTITENSAAEKGGGIYGVGAGWAKTAVVTVNKQPLTVARHVPGFDEGSNTYSGNSNGQKFGAWGPGEDKWVEDAGYDVCL